MSGSPGVGSPSPVPADPKRDTAIILAVLVVAEVASAFEVGMMYAALPTMNRVFQDPVGVGWLITAFLLVASASCAISSRLGDLFGRSQVLAVMLALAVLGSGISAFAPSLGWIIAGRTVQGAAEAVLPLSWGLVRERFPLDRVPFGISYLAGTASIAGGLGVFLGGVIVDHFAWQSLFYVSGGIAALALLLTLLLLAPSPKPPRPPSLDLVGGVLFVPAVAVMLFAITRGKTWGWADQRTLGSFVGGIALLSFWARFEWRHPNPLIDVRQLANRQIALTNVAMALFGLGPSQLMLVLLLLLQQPTWTGVGLAVSATFAGAVKIPSNLTALVTAPWCARLTARHGARRAMIYSVVLLMTAWAVITLKHDDLGFLIVMILVVGAGGSMIYAAMPNLIVEAISEDRTSEATGLSQVVRTTFTAVGSQLTLFLLHSSTVSDPARGNTSYPSAEAYNLTFAAITTTAVLILLVALALPKRRGARLCTPSQRIPAREAGQAVNQTPDATK